LNVRRSREQGQVKGRSTAVASRPSAPWMAPSTRAQSSTDRVMGPILSMVHDRLMQPYRLTRPNAGRGPASPHWRLPETMLRGGPALAQGTTAAPGGSLAGAEAGRPRGGRGGGAGRRPARPQPGVPCRAGQAADPAVALGEGPQRELGDEDRPGLVEPLGHGG